MKTMCTSTSTSTTLTTTSRYIIKGEKDINMNINIKKNHVFGMAMDGDDWVEDRFIKERR